MPSDSSLVRAICKIPREFRRGNISPRESLERFGYDSAREAVTVAALRSCLEEEPELITEWLHWSEDKRTSDGWFFSVRDDVGEVGYLGRAEPPTKFTPLAEACAQFVHREIESIHSSGRIRDRTA